MEGRRGGEESCEGVGCVSLFPFLFHSFFPPLILSEFWWFWVVSDGIEERAVTNWRQDHRVGVCRGDEDVLVAEPHLGGSPRV